MPPLEEVLASSTSGGLAPREGLELLKLELGRNRPLLEPRHGPQAGKAGYPRSQDADTPLVNGLFLLNLDRSDTHIHNIDAKRCKVNNDSTLQKKEFMMNMIGSIPQQNFYFQLLLYHDKFYEKELLL